jgi:hypothetical protein
VLRLEVLELEVVVPVLRLEVLELEVVAPVLRLEVEGVVGVVTPVLRVVPVLWLPLFTLGASPREGVGFTTVGLSLPGVQRAVGMGEGVLG